MAGFFILFFTIIKAGALFFQNFHEIPFFDLFLKRLKREALWQKIISSRI
jgi:hypothetical protein